MKSVLLLSLVAYCALGVPLGQTSSYYTPYVSSYSYQSYPGAFWKGLGYQQESSFGKYYQEQYPYYSQYKEYFSSPVQALQLFSQIEQRLFYYQQKLEEYQQIYPQYQWQKYVEAINSYLMQFRQLQGYFQNYVQSSEPIPTYYQTQAIQLFQQIYYLFQEIESAQQGLGYYGYSQGYQYSSYYPKYQYGSYGYKSSYPYYPYRSYEPYHAVQTVV